MREFGVRRYGDTTYRHCLAESADAAADWFAHAVEAAQGKNFQALVMDVASVGSREPQTVFVRRGALTESGRNVTDLGRTSRLT